MEHCDNSVNSIEQDFKYYLNFVTNGNVLESRRLWRDEYNQLSKYQHQIIFWASASKQPEMMDFLYEKNLFKVIDNLMGRSVLHWVCDSEDIDVLQRCIELGADVNAIDRKGDSLIYFASRRSKIEVVRMLLAAGSETKGCNLQIQVRYFHALSNLQLMTFDIDEWSKFSTFGDLKAALVAKMNVKVDITEMQLWGFDLLGKKVNKKLELTDQFHCKMDPGFCLLKLMDELILTKKIGTDVFECEDVVANRRYYGWAISRHSYIGEVGKLVGMKSASILEVVDMRTDKGINFAISHVIGGMPFCKYRENIDSVKGIKFHCIHILEGIRELISANIRINCKVWVDGDVRCRLVPSGKVSNDQDSLDKIYTEQLMDILVRQVPSSSFATFTYPVLKVNLFVTDFINHIKSQMKSRDNMIDYLLNSDYL